MKAFNRNRVALASAIASLLTALGGCSKTPLPQEPSQEVVRRGAQQAALSQSFAANSLIIPMDTTYQDNGTIKAFGLVYALLKANVPVYWIAKTGKAQGDVDFTASATDVSTSATISNYGYKAGPFVIDSSNRAAALTVISSWTSSVTVHSATSSFTADVRRTMTAAPTLALFLDGNEDIAFRYLNAAGIPDSTGKAWPTAKTATYPTYPDIISPAQVAGTNTGGTVDGTLFNSDGTAKWCNLSSMHWSTVNNEAVREVRQWLTGRPVHAFMECEAAATFENSTNGHFLTSAGIQDDGNTANTATNLQPDSLFAQYDGSFTVVNGSLDSIGLNTGSTIDAATSILLARNGATTGSRMSWLTGYLDGNSANGKVSYLAGHDYSDGNAGGTVTMPISSNPSSNGARFFLQALLESPCASPSEGQPVVTLSKSAPASVSGTSITYTLSFANTGNAPAMGATLTDVLPTGLVYTSSTGTPTPTVVGQTVTWNLGNMAAGTNTSVTVTATVVTDGTYTNSATLTYKVGATSFTVTSNTTSTTRDTTAPSAPVISVPAAGASVGSVTPTISGTAEANSTVTVKEGGTTLCTATTDSSGNWSCVSSTLSQGSHTINATAKDAAGNTSTASPNRTFTVDTVAPSAPAISVPAAGATVASVTPTISGTAEANSTVTVVEGGTTLCTATTDSSGNWSCTSSTLSQGSHTITATAKDAAGNTSTASPNRTFTVDTVAPSAPVINAPAAGASVASTTPTISGTAEANSTVTVVEGTTTLCTATTDSSGNWSCTSSTLAQGSHTISATSKDAAGNTSAASPNRTFTVDTAAPSAPVINAPAAGATVATVTPTISGTAEANSTVTVVEGGTTLCTATTDSSGNWSCTSSALGQGSHTISATAKDAAGNTSTASPNRTFTVDTVAPSAPVINAPAAGASVASTTPTISGTAEANSTVTVKEGATTLCTATTDGAGNWSCVSSTLSQGSHTINATAKDAAGNTSTASPNRTFTVDTVAPSAPAISVPAAGATVASVTPTISGTAEANSTVTVVEGGTTLCTATTDSSGNWSCTSSTLGQGSHTISATAKDAAGNTSTASPNRTFTVDTVAPNAPAISAPAAGASVASTTPTISGTAEANSLVTVKEGGTTLCTATADSSGNWSCVSSTLSVGSHTISATATDAGGNTSAASANRTFTVDTSTTVTLTAPTSGSTLTTGTVAFSGTAEGNDTVVVTIPGQTGCTATASAAGAWSCNASLPDGSYTATATATDSAGNTATATTNFTIDSTPPAAPTITAPAAGATSNTGSVAFTGTAEAGASVTVSAGGSTCTATADSSGNWSCTLSPALADGSYTATATAKDAAGNTSTSTNRAFSVDTQAPDTAITSGPPSPTRSAGAAFVVVGTDPSPSSGVTGFMCNLDGAGFVACPGGASGSFTITASGDGSHTLLVAAVDAAGNVDPTPASYTWVLDATAPAAPTITTPADNSTVASTTPNIGGTAEPGSTVTVTEGGTTVCTATTDSSGNWSCTAGFLADGPHTLSAVSTDAAGNASAPATVHVLVDSAPPDTQIVSGPPAATNATTANFTFSSNESGVTYQCALDGAAFTACSNPASLSGLADGSHTLEVRAVDAAGNIDPTPASRTWTVDTVAPGAPVITSPTNGSTVANPSPGVGGTAEPGSTVTVTEGGSPVCTAVADASGNWTCTPTTPLGDGSNTLTATATDPAGNTGPAATVTFTVDSQAPDTTIVSGPAATTRATSASFTFSSNETGVSYRCSLDGAAFAPCANPDTLTGLASGSHTLQVAAVDAAGNVDPTPASYTWTVDPNATNLAIDDPGDGSQVATSSPTVDGTAPSGPVEVSVDGTLVCAAATVTNGVWSCPTTGLGDGSHTISVTGPDGSGGNGTVTSTFTVDTTPPDTSITSGPPARSNSAQATFSFASTEAGSTFVCSLDGAAFAPCPTPDTLSGLADGQHTLKVAAVDPAGNTDPSPATWSWEVRTTTPSQPTLDSPADGASVPTGTPTFAGSADPGSTVTVSVDGNPVCSATAAADGTWSCAPTTGIPDGPHPVSVVSTDGFGNSSAPTQGTLIVDTTPPETTITTHPPATSTSSSATFAFSSNEPGVSYQCALDGAAFGPCPNPDTFTGLTDGSHTLQVRAVDAAGNVDPTPASYTWTVDTTPTGQVTLDSPGNGSSVNTASPTYSGSSTAGDTVTVKVDGTTVCTATADSAGHWSCTSTGPGLTDGQHTVVATAVDGVGTSHGTAGASFTVDTHAPDTRILVGPPPSTTSTDAAFTFASDEAGVTYECALDSGAFAACPNPDSLSGLGVGSHTLQVRAVDAAGNVDPTPASYSWTIVGTTTSSSSSSSSSSGSTGSTGSTSSTASTGSSGTTASSTTGTTATTATTGGTLAGSTAGSTSASSTGSTGSTSATASTGSTGSTGSTSTASTTGSTGSTSSTSSTGSTASTGSTGSTTASGTTIGGTSGTSGSSGTGSTTGTSTSGSTSSTSSTGSTSSSSSSGSTSGSSGSTGSVKDGGKVAGGGCSCGANGPISAADGLLALLSLVGLAWRRRPVRRAVISRAAVAAVAGAAVVAGAGTASAQTTTPNFSTVRYDPAERGSDWFALDSIDLRGQVRPVVGATLDWGYKPLVVYNQDGTERAALVRHQLLVHVGGGVVLFDRFRLGADLPLAAFQKGDNTTLNGALLTSAGKAALGDLRLSGDVRLVGTYGDLFTLAAGVAVHLPTGDATQYVGDGTVRAAPRVLASGRYGIFEYAARVGFTWRSKDAPVDDAPLGSELDVGAAAGARLVDGRLLIGPEITAATVVGQRDAFLGSRSTPSEALLSAHFKVINDLTVGAGFGPGLGQALGTPQLRGLLSVDWSPRPPETPPDADGDGIADNVDACPNTPGVASADPKKNGCPPPPPPPDADGDGIPDAQDACPKVAGVTSADPKLNGCPPDADGDGIPDNVDACPKVRGVANADPKKNGCPADQDGDGIPDFADACPTVPGVPNMDTRLNGCPPPPPDTDGDGILDSVDACPTEPGIPELKGCPAKDTDGDGIPDHLDNCPTEAGPKENGGCPPKKKQLVVITKEKLVIKEQVFFDTAKASIQKKSFPLLDQVAKILTEHPEIEHVDVEGHTDNVGKPDKNMKLSQDRADSVRVYLIKKGVDPKRLESHGYGDTKPIDSNKTAKGKANNRRVEFNIRNPEKPKETPAGAESPAP